MFSHSLKDNIGLMQDGCSQVTDQAQSHSKASWLGCEVIPWLNKSGEHQRTKPTKVTKESACPMNIERPGKYPTVAQQGAMGRPQIATLVCSIHLTIFSLPLGNGFLHVGYHSLEDIQQCGPNKFERLFSGQPNGFETRNTSVSC